MGLSFFLSFFSFFLAGFLFLLGSPFCWVPLFVGFSFFVLFVGAASLSLGGAASKGYRRRERARRARKEGRKGRG